MTGFRFGRFELDPRSRELLKDGVRLRLQDQPFEVLAMMLEHPGEVLTRDELRERLWPNGTFVDFEHGLNAVVKRLRAALGDNADRPRFVETLHRRGYRFIAPVERTDGPAADRYRSPGTAGKLRLAVLPFTNVGDAGSQDYFSDGLTEELITQLGRLFADRLAVVARASSMLVPRRDRTIREIGEALRASYVVEGRVRREADRVRITAQLVETGGETQLWAESYERQLSDCLLVQSDVATHIVHSLAMELLPGHRAARANGTRRAGAYHSYVTGRFHWNKAGPEGLLQAIACYEEALAIDPRFAAAYAALGRAHVGVADHYVAEPRQALEAGRAAASRALELDVADSEAYLTLAEVRRALHWDWRGAEGDYRHALALNPSNEGAHRLYGVFLAAQGRTDESTASAERACDLDPLCLVVNTSAAWVHYAAGRHEAAVEHCRHTLNMDPAFAPARRMRAAALFQIGRVDEGIAELDAVIGTQEDPIALAWLAHAVAVCGNTGRALQLVRQLEELARGRYVSAYHRALPHVALRDLDTAFTLLARACDERDPALMNVAVEPRFEALRRDSRYRAIINRIGLVEGSS